MMVATDVAARGLDVDDIDLVIQATYQSRNIDSIVHRAGRTGRAGKSGINIIFGIKHDIDFFVQLEKNLKIDFTIRAGFDSADEDDQEKTKTLSEQKFKL